MRIVLTGASSFTGYWFAKVLAGQGVEVIAPLSGPADSYAGMRAERVRDLRQSCMLIHEAPFGSDAFMALVRRLDRLDVFCHHWAQVREYRSDHFDPLAALADNTRNLDNLLVLLKERSCKGLVLTGSIGEQREGVGTDRRAFSPYGLSKGLSSDLAEFACHRHGIAFDKFVVANPFGPREDERFTHYLMQTWRNGQTAHVRTPDYLRDNIHVDLLALAYAAFVRGRGDSILPGRRYAPSLYRETQGAFAQRVAREVQARTSLACRLQLDVQKDFREPLDRINADEVRAEFPMWSEVSAWDEFSRYYELRGPTF
jgi:UDP-glucose 4-epimerase